MVERTPQDFTSDVRRVVHTTDMADSTSAHLSSGAVLGLGPAHKRVSRLDFPNLLPQLQLLVEKGGQRRPIRSGMVDRLGRGEACRPHRILESGRCFESRWVAHIGVSMDT